MPDITKKCRITGKEFTINEWEQDFLKKFEASLPTLCPEERHRRRLAHRNERKIYKDKCDLTGKSIISIYSPDKPFKVYSQEAWWGDNWDPKEYGRDYNFNRPFFEQFHELQQRVPRLSLMNSKGENSEYCNITVSNKNCYLVFGGDFNEDCSYSCFSMGCRDTSDVYFVNKSELTYDSIDCTNCYNIKYSQNSHGCRDSSFLFECRNCENCFGCVGLRNKKYHIFNKPYSPEEYKKKIEEFRLDTWSGVQKVKTEFEKFRLQFPHKFASIVNSENVSGDYIINAKNCENCYAIDGPAEDLKDIFMGGWNLQDSASSDHLGHKAELFYEMLGSIDGHHNAFCTFCWSCHDTFYCDMVTSSHDLFGCVNMKRSEYCILNKQYSKNEYLDLLKRIIEHMKGTGEWGEFFPMEFSPFAYNETVAQDYFPLSKKEAQSQGLKWLDEEINDIGTSPKIPDSIHDVKDDIMKKTLVCEKTGRPYNIIPQELKFYRQLEIPVPHFAPETRNEMRIAMRKPLTSWDRQCTKCNKKITTSYSPSSPETVYCEKCYLETVF